MKVGVLTSSRADFGIYMPLLEKLKEHHSVELHLIVFGMHTLAKYDSFQNIIDSHLYYHIHKVGGMPLSDSVEDVTKGYGELIVNFSAFWQQHKFDILIALGDRFEMAAAVQSTVPYRLKVAHLHGGETTLGAIDNIYRHQITLASHMHFVATESFGRRVSEILGDDSRVHNVGALSLSDIADTILPEWQEVRRQFNIPGEPFILSTFHPETMKPERNEGYATEMKKALLDLSQKLYIVMTMPNADTMGSIYRNVLLQLEKEVPNRISLIENFGRLNYFSALKSCEFLLGNTSSGILEAASFGKFVVNVGDRQNGRLRSDNVVDVPFEAEKISEAAKVVARKHHFRGENKYYKQDTAKNIVEIIIHDQT